MLQSALSYIDSLGAILKCSVISALAAPQEPGAPLETQQVLFVQPADGRYAHFFGETAADGSPVIVPTPPPPGAEAAAADGVLEACVGDVITVIVEVVSGLAQPVEVEDVGLVLALLQEIQGETQWILGGLVFSMPNRKFSLLPTYILAS